MQIGEGWKFDEGKTWGLLIHWEKRCENFWEALVECGVDQESLLLK